MFYPFNQLKGGVVVGRAELTDAAKSEAVAAFKFAADKCNMSLHGQSVELVAHIIASRAINQAISAGDVVESVRYKAEVEKLTSDVNRHRNNWASVMTQADHQLQRVQAALSEIPDRALAERIADKIGVILPEMEDGQCKLFAA